MSLKDRFRFPKTLSFKLTLWYSVIFAFSILGGFLSFNFLLSSKLHKELDQNLLNEAKEISMLMNRKGISQVKTAIVLEAESEGVDKVFYRLLDMDGKSILKTDDSHWGIDAGRKAINIISGGRHSFFETVAIPGRSYSARSLYSRLGEDHILQIMVSTEDSMKFLTICRQIFLLIMGFIFLFSIAVGWFMARRALTGVEEVTKTAISVSDGEFDKRVKVTGHGEEIDRLATTFNRMLERVQGLIKDIREINDNIAHDLRSPVTRIRGTAENSIMTAKPGSEQESVGAAIIEECDGLLSMINTMLDISEAEAGVSKLNISVVNLSRIIIEACELFQPVADSKDIRIIYNTDDDIFISADKVKIQRLIANLLDNGIKYSDNNGTVIISAERRTNGAAVSVKDNGIGISGEDLPKIFNRFYRCDQSRSFQGVGLGLSLARAIVTLHKGDISVSSSPQKGSTFTFTIPADNIS